MTTGELAAQADVGVETVRYYERRGLLPVPPRRPSGYRRYEEEHVRRIRFIKRAQGVGFALGEIEELLAIRVRPGGTSGEVKALTAQKVQEIDAKIRDLERMRATLQALHAACDGEVPLEDCPILRAFEGSSR